MSNQRGSYGTPRIGSDGSPARGSSWGTWIVGGLIVGGAVLVVRHQSAQIAKLYATAGLPHESLTDDLRGRAKALTEGARARIHRFTARKDV